MIWKVLGKGIGGGGDIGGGFRVVVWGCENRGDGILVPEKVLCLVKLRLGLCVHAAS